MQRLRIKVYWNKLHKTYLIQGIISYSLHLNLWFFLPLIAVNDLYTKSDIVTNLVMYIKLAYHGFKIAQS